MLILTAMQHSCRVLCEDYRVAVRIGTGDAASFAGDACSCSRVVGGLDTDTHYECAAGELALEVDLSSVGAPTANGHATVNRTAPAKAALPSKRAADAPVGRGSKAGGKAAKDPAAEKRQRQLLEEAEVGLYLTHAACCIDKTAEEQL